jgi:AcrR family transcriptional regulator
MRHVPTAADAREKVFAAGLALLVERGPAAVRVRDVADAAGTSTMAVYTHFGSKQGLLEELYRHGMLELERALAAVPATSDRRGDALAMLLGYRAFALGNEALYGLMFERAAPDFVPSDASRNEGLRSFELLRETVRAGDGDPTGAAYLLWGTTHGLVTLELTHRRWGGPVMEHLQGGSEGAFVRAIETILDGLGIAGP